jgi:hypothetical protein
MRDPSLPLFDALPPAPSAADDDASAPLGTPRGRTPTPGKLSAQRFNRLIDTAEAIRATPALADDAISFMARALVQATLPHSDPGDVRAWGRENGDFSLAIEPGYIIQNKQPVSLGIPYGVIPRLLLFWITTEATRTGSRTLMLGSSLAEFMRKVDLDPTTGGGPRSDAFRLKEQMKRLFSARIACTYGDGSSDFGRSQFSVADEVRLWWNPAETTMDSLFDSAIELGERFFQEITERPVPVDVRALTELKQSPLALDLYAWLTYRVSYLKKPQAISWQLLQGQFGADYSNIRAFRFKVRQLLKRITLLYPDLRLDDSESGLILYPSPPHVARVADEALPYI